MNEAELRDYQMWTMQDLQDFLLLSVSILINIFYYHKNSNRVK